MGVYIKVTPQVYKKLGESKDFGYRNQLADGNYLLWQSDIDGVPGARLDERVAYVGGAKLSPPDARAETDGVENPAYVYTPEAFMDEVAEDEPMESSETPDEVVEPLTDENNE